MQDANTKIIAIVALGVILAISILANILQYQATSRFRQDLEKSRQQYSDTSQLLADKSREFETLAKQKKSLEEEITDNADKGPSEIDTAAKASNMSAGADRTKQQSTSSLPSSTQFLRFPDQPDQVVPVWTTKSAFDEGAKHLARHDMYGLADQTMAGLFSDVPPGTACMRLEGGFGWVKVRILEGDLKGEAVYTFSEAYND